MRTSVKLLAGCLGSGLLLLAGAGAAQAAPAPLSRGAVECGNAPGPGAWNRVCVSVDGRGEQVGSVEVSYDSTTARHYPASFCDVSAHVSGTYADGRRYNDYARVGCAKGATSWTFTVRPGHDRFQRGSWLCGTVGWRGQTSAPECVRIG
jgi:hypothetical protein